MRLSPYVRVREVADSLIGRRNSPVCADFCGALVNVRIHITCIRCLLAEPSLLFSSVYNSGRARYITDQISRTKKYLTPSLCTVYGPKCICIYT